MTLLDLQKFTSEAIKSHEVNEHYTDTDEAQSVVYCTAGQTTKTTEICKNIIYIFTLRRRRLCEVGIQSETEFAHIFLLLR